MDLQKLSIGDWVNVFEDDAHKKCSPYRVVGLVEADREVQYDDPKSKFIHEVCDKSDCEPVPLTEEILLANGFTEKEVEDYSCFGFGSLYSHETEGHEVAVFWQDSCNAMTAAGTEYTTDLVWNVTMFGEGGEFDKTYRNKYINVHEFQHALRLCGLDELANNLKIK